MLVKIGALDRETGSGSRVLAHEWDNGTLMVSFAVDGNRGL